MLLRGKKTKKTTLFGHTMCHIKEMCINTGGRKERRNEGKEKRYKKEFIVASKYRTKVDL